MLSVVNFIYLHLFLWGILHPTECIDYFQPEQIHLAFGETTQDLVVVWSTPNPTEESIVEYGEVNITQFADGDKLKKEQWIQKYGYGLKHRAKGYANKFIDGGELKREQWIHMVTLTGLQRNSGYFYHCGSPQGWSALFFFKTTPAGNNFEVRGVLYGDMGNKNARSLGPLQREVQNDLMYDLILHVGDFAYDMYVQNALVGDQFMRQIEPIAAYVPYMTCPGNHERMYNFSNYKNRFRMPSDKDGRMFYSFDIGPIHFISINTDAYYSHDEYGEKQIETQYNWLVDDLEKATRNRAERPWIILFGHHPMYCSTDDNQDCLNKDAKTRVGIDLHGAGNLQYGLEKLLSKYGVDIAVWAHEHTYERLWPIYDYKVYNGSADFPYVDPKAPVHFTSGSAGCQEYVDKFLPQPEWSAYRSSHYGYTRFKAFNSSHIYLEQVSVNTDPPIVIDQYWIIKTSHGPFGLH